MTKNHKITGQKISQKDKEIGALIDLFKRYGVTRYLEIGARQGNTFYDIMTSLPVGSLGVAVDLPGGTWGKTGTDVHLKNVCQKLNDMGYNVSYILGDSTDKEVIDEVEMLGAPFHAALIDGDHRYAGVKADWENYSPMVESLVAFHDIDGHGVVQSSDPSLAVEVPILWDELKVKYPHEEYIDRLDQPHRPMGIGVINLNPYMEKK